MSMRKRLEERIRKKEAEIQELEMQMREGRSYIQALQEALKLLPREAAEGAPDVTENTLRPGGMVATARDILQKHGRPMHVLDLLTAIGKEPSRANRASLGGSLSAYVRKGEIFTRPGPNTFGLMEFLETQRTEPPAGFGRRVQPEADGDEESSAPSE